MQNLYNRVSAELKRNKNRQHAFVDKKYHKYEGHESLGITASILDRLLRGFRLEIRSLKCVEALSLAQKLYSSRIEEYTLVGNYVLQQKLECLTAEELPYLDKNLDNLVSWSTTDGFCIDVLQPLLLRYPKAVFRMLKKWNASSNIWKQRASVVVFTRKIGESGKFTKEGLRLCENLAGAKVDLIRKAVGWALKDLMRGDKKVVLDYVKQLRERGVSAVIVLYALRGLGNAERRKILAVSRQ